MKSYQIAVGACGGQILYRTIHADNAEEAARKLLPEGTDRETFEQKAAYLREHELPERAVRAKDAPFLDVTGRPVHPGDALAVIRTGPGLAIVTARAERETRSTLTCTLGEGKTYRYRADETDGVTLLRVVKLDGPWAKAGEGEAADALGRALREGDRVAYRDEVYLNFCRGFRTGTVVRVTPKTIKIRDDKTGTVCRRRQDLTVRLSQDAGAEQE